jgi:alginate O-acetyltransferase complex protein AlgI
VSIFFTPYLIPILFGALLIYWFGLRRDEERVLFVALLSIASLAALHPVFAVIAVAITAMIRQVVVYVHARRVSIRAALIFSISLGIIALAFGKYGASMAHAVWGHNDWVTAHLLMPLGLSYFVFRCLQYVFDHVRGVLTDTSFVRLLAFLFFIPTFQAGPIETYQGMYGKRSLSFDRQLFYKGLRRIALGYFKKVFLVDFLMRLVFGSMMLKVGALGYHPSTAQPLKPLYFVVVVFIRAYADLSAYTDLAIGFAALFGFRIMENFDRPLVSRNLGEFWRSWHISLSNWCRNNVYFPIYGATRKAWLGMYASMLTMGLWHYVSFTWTAWGLYHGTGLVTVAWWQRKRKARRKALKKRGKKSWASHWIFTPLPYVLTFFYAAAGYAFVSSLNIRHGLRLFVYFWIGPLIWLKHLVM